MKIIVGLGNIGEKYKDTRHNAGFMFLDNLKVEKSWTEEPKFSAITSKTTIFGEPALLVKPTTLMNLSGIAVSKILNFFKIPTEDLIVIFDDIDLPLGKTRYKEEGSAGTHNGIKSLIKELGTTEFKRIKIGIESRGLLAPKEQNISSFVLEKFNNEELEILKKSLIEAEEKLKSCLTAKKA